jgi:phospholipid/cholesterol/gamma-HCH transport system substrate-binding protein
LSLFRKNLMVGATVIFSIVLLGVLMLKFGALPAQWFGPTKIPIELHVARADGLSPGSAVSYLGVTVGNIHSIARSDDQTEVVIEALLDAGNPPPANVVGRIRSQIVGGGSNISLEVPDGKPQGKLAAHAKVPTRFIGVDLLPPEFAQLATELRLTAEQIRKSDLTKHLDETLLSFRTQAEKAGKLVDSLDATVNDPKLREDLKTSVANFRQATESATKVGQGLEKFTANLDKMGENLNTVSVNANATITRTQGHIDDLSKQMTDRMAQVSRILDQFQSIANKVDQGKGSAGLLVNDTKLYESLVDTSKELNLTITDLKLLVKQWTDEGVYIKLNK